MKKVLFLGSKPIGYKCLEFLLQNQEALNIEIVGVLSNDNTRFGDEYAISSLVKKYSLRFIDRVDDILALEDISYIISVQYHLILKPQHIAVAKELAINLHMAPLPEYRGCNQFSFAIYNGAKEFGTTLHCLESGIDNGAIIAERRFPIPENCLVKDLYDMTFEQSITLFNENIADIIKGNYTLTPQQKLIAERGTAIYYRKDITALKQIDLQRDSQEEIGRKVRATAMPGFEPPYAMIDGMKYYLIPEKIYNEPQKNSD